MYNNNYCNSRTGAVYYILVSLDSIIKKNYYVKLCTNDRTIIYSNNIKYTGQSKNVPIVM